MRQIAFAVTRLLLENKIIGKEDEEVYAYGLQLILNSGTTMVVIIGISLLTRQFGLTAIFLIALSSIRHYIGGYHANSYLKCFCISCMSYIGMLIIVHYISPLLSMEVPLIGSWLINGYLLYKGSLNSEKNPKTIEEMKKRKIISRCLTLLYSSIITILYSCGCVMPKIIWLLFYVQAITALGLVVVKRQRRH